MDQTRDSSRSLTTLPPDMSSNFGVPAPIGQCGRGNLPIQPWCQLNSSPRSRCSGDRGPLADWKPAASLSVAPRQPNAPTHCEGASDVVTAAGAWRAHHAKIAPTTDARLGASTTVQQRAAAAISTTDNTRMKQAREKLADAKKRIRRLQQAIEAGANPTALVDALNRAEEERQAAHNDLDQIPTAHRLNCTDIAVIVDELGDVGTALDRAHPAGLEELYAALRLEMIYDVSTKTVDVTIRPTGRGSTRVRGGT
jgi:hypothetical protein